jgi:hypothetical protein
MVRGIQDSARLQISSFLLQLIDAKALNTSKTRGFSSIVTCQEMDNGSEEDVMRSRLIFLTLLRLAQLRLKSEPCTAITHATQLRCPLGLA